MTNDEVALRRLREDATSPDEAERLLPVVSRLPEWTTPQPTRRQTQALIARLQPEMPARTRPSFDVLRFAWLLLQAQLKVVRREIWAASLLVMALGTLIALPPVSADSTWPMALFAPIVAATGVAFIYGPLVDPALEIELATPVSPRLVLLARLVLVFGFDLALGLVASVALAMLNADLSFWPLVMSWLAPMAFLSALAFLLTALSSDSLLGMLVSLVLWGMQAIRQAPAVAEALWYVPNLMTPEARPWLWVLAALLGGLALWIGGREERWLDRLA
jgi:hypothetical protein